MTERAHHLSAALVGAALSALLAAGATASAAETTASPEEAVRAVIEGVIAADNAGDLEGVLGFYADDAVLLPPDRPAIVGKEAIGEHYLAMFAAFDLELTVGCRETVVAGDWAFDRGAGAPSSGRSPTLLHDPPLGEAAVDSLDAPPAMPQGDPR